MTTQAVTGIRAELGKIGIEAGQEYDDKTNKKLRTVFKNLDLNNDKKISEEEICAYEDYLQLKELNNKKHEELNAFKSRANAPIKAGACAGIAGFATGAISSNALLKGILKRTSEGSWFNKAFFKEIVTEHFATCDSKNYSIGDHLYTSSEYVGTSLKKGTVIATGVILAGLLGYNIYKLVAKSSKVQEAKQEVAQRKADMEQENVQVKNLDRQYTNINTVRSELQQAEQQKGEELTKEEVMGILFFSTIQYMMESEREMERKQRDEEDYGDYYRENMERSRYSNDGG